MIDNDQQSDYTKFYLIRQEQIVVEQLKKILDLEVKMTMVIEKANNLALKYEETLKTIETQSEIINQAGVSIEELTKFKLENEQKIKDLSEQLDKADETNRSIVSDKKTVVGEIAIKDGRIRDLEREVNRLNLEIKNLISEKPNKKTSKTKDETF